MIQVSDVISSLNSRLDAQGSDYYNFVDNYKNAINESVKFIVNLINYALAQNKVTEECLAELSVARVYRTSKFSRISIDETIWAIVSVNPLPETVAHPDLPAVSTPDDYQSYYRTDLIHIDSWYGAKRLTKEEWEVNKGNPFAWGNAVTKCASLTEGSDDNVLFGYLNPYRFIFPQAGQSATMSMTLVDNSANGKNDKIFVYIPGIWNGTISWTYGAGQQLGTINDSAAAIATYLDALFNSLDIPITVTADGAVITFTTDEETAWFNSDSAKFYYANKNNLFSLSSGATQSLTIDGNPTDCFLMTGGVTTITDEREITIRPYLDKKLCTLFVVEFPYELTDQDEDGLINLHGKLFNFLVEKCLQYISYEQGDQTNIFSLSQRELASIVKILA